MAYEEKYNELVELSHSNDSKIKEKANAWQTAIGLQDVNELKFSPYLLDTARQHIEGDISIDVKKVNLIKKYNS